MAVSTRKAFRVAPSIAGVRAASIWRFWCQGDEFYAAARDVAHAAKVSFHRGGNWQLRIGHSVIRLFATRPAGLGWLHVVSIQWIVLPDAFKPPSKVGEQVERVETPPESKCALNLLASVGKATADPALPSEGGRFVWRGQLRDGCRILLHAVTLPLTSQDRQAATHHLAELELSFRQLPDPEDFYGEIAWVMSRPEIGNLVAITPLTRDVLHRSKITG